MPSIEVTSHRATPGRLSVSLANWRFRRAAILILALFLAAGIFLLRLADDNEANAILVCW